MNDWTAEDALADILVFLQESPIIEENAGIEASGDTAASVALTIHGRTFTLTLQANDHSASPAKTIIPTSSVASDFTSYHGTPRMAAST